MHIIDSVAKKLQSGTRLTEADAVALYESTELLAIGQLADEANRLKNNETVFYNVNRHINPTNICALSCKFCAYSRKPGEEGAYAYSIDEMIKKAGEAVAQGATEVHMVGGLHPRWKYDYYKDMIGAVKQAFPQLHLKAFTAVELDWLARKARKTIPEVLEELQGVGLGSLPGGGAEIFHPEVRDAICDTKVSAEQWLDTHRQAHKLGMMSNCTMLYGHIETYAHRVDHMRRLRELQDETHGFNAFIPLSFQPFQNEMGIDEYTYGYDDLKTVAIARLFLDNFHHIKAYWIMLGQDVAQLALNFGANDLDGTVIEEKISRMAGGRAGMAMPRNFINDLVRKGARTPCERDTLYNPIYRDEAAKAEALEPRTPRYNSGKQLARTMAARLEQGEALTPEDLLALATKAPLHELGQLAGTLKRQAKSATKASFAPAIVITLHSVERIGEAMQRIGAALETTTARHGIVPTVLVIELAHNNGDALQNHEFGLLLELIWASRQSYAALDISVRGLKALWKLAQSEHADVAALCKRLRDAGAATIESSPEESETDLTTAEIVALHGQIHQHPSAQTEGTKTAQTEGTKSTSRPGDDGTATIAKAELDAPSQGAGAPLWESFIRRVMALAKLQTETGFVLGLSVEAAKGSFITAAEYMRALAIARLAAGSIPQIIAPLAAIPVLSPASGLGTSRFQHPAEKIGAIALHFGANDLGLIDAEHLGVVPILRQLRSAAFTPVIRDGRFHAQRAPAGVAAGIEGSRHIPPLARDVPAEGSLATEALSGDAPVQL